jgi:T5SS/PEP-CTERM-associated repeat protein
VLVTGPGSVWSNSGTFHLGDWSAGNSLVISNGGQVLYTESHVGGNSDYGSNNSVVVTGLGSVWRNSNTLVVGNYGAGNSLVISDGGQVFGAAGILGEMSGDNNSVLVTGPGSVWSNSGALSIGYTSAHNSLVISNGGLVVNGDGYVGAYSNGNSNSVRVVSGGVWWNSTLRVGTAGWSSLVVSGGSVLATNLRITALSGFCDNLVQLDSGNIIVTNATHDAVLEVRRGKLILNGGIVTADSLISTNGACGTIEFNGGLLDSGGTAVTNGTAFTVGNGVGVAEFHLAGGVHSFAKGLRIRANAVLSGCGTINGAVIVDTGGTVLADCGGTLTFTGMVMNNGTVKAVNGTTVDFLGPVVNNGLLDVINGNTNFHSTFINNGIFLDAAGDWDGDGMSNLQEYLAGTDPTNSLSVLRITAIAQEGDDMRVTWTMGNGKTNALQATAGDDGGGFTNTFADLFIVTNTVGTATNYLDTGGATNAPSRFYRVRLVP